VIAQTLKNCLVAIGIGFVLQLIQDWLGTDYLDTFLRENVVNLLVALLAINTATMSIVLTKIRELVEQGGSRNSFERSQRQMLLSIQEQVGLVIVALTCFMLENAPALTNVSNGRLAVFSVATATFVYGIMILYDTAKSVFVILEFPTEKKAAGKGADLRE